MMHSIGRQEEGGEGGRGKRHERYGRSFLYSTLLLSHAVLLVKIL